MSSSPSQSSPPFNAQLAAAGQQFVSASSALISAIENIDARAEGLHAAQSAAASDIVDVRERMAGLQQRVVAIEAKPADSTKWAQLALSVLAFVLSLISVAYSIKFGTQTAASDRQKVEEAAEQALLTSITNIVDLEPQTHSSGALVNPGALSASVRFKAEANKVEIYRSNHGFAHIEAKNFASLMRAVLSFPDIEHARTFWSSLDTVNLKGLNDSLEIAIIDADFARVIASNDEVSAAAHRLAVCLQDHDIEPGQRIDAHLALAQMYASVIPPTENTISTARRDVKLANETLTSIRASQAEFGKDLDARIALISNSIDSAQSQKNQIDRQREEQQRQEREKREQQRQQQEKEKKDKQQIDQSPTVPSTKSP